MTTSIKKIFTLLLVVITLPTFAQNQWIGQLSLSDFDCNNQTACYTLYIKGINSEPWALGDQNYRFFFDADNISISSVTSLLPDDFYSTAQIDEILEIVGQNQEAFSPLDNIDDNLGFLDFNILAQAKQFPSLVKQISNESFVEIAEICLEVSADLMENTGEEYAMNLLFSRPLTAGQITNQYIVISEISEANRTKATQSVGFLDINYSTGLDAQLGELCRIVNTEENILNDRKVSFFPNPYRVGETLTYDAVLIAKTGHEITIYDNKSQLVKHFPKLAAGNTSIEIEERLPAGVYFVHLKSENHQVMKELIVIN